MTHTSPNRKLDDAGSRIVFQREYVSMYIGSQQASKVCVHNDFRRIEKCLGSQAKRSLCNLYKDRKKIKFLNFRYKKAAHDG
ncbi:hypothetical protein IX95_10405 [Vibrio sp. B183]|nr:hypothetical protein IX95_10405 [Vibrio sp. B183]